MPHQPWLLLPQIDPTPELRAAVGGHPLVAQLLAQRGVDTPAKAAPFLDSAAYTPAPPTALVGLDRAAHLLHDAVQTGQRIFVWGDFDVDGQTSTALLVAALQELSTPERVRFHVPNRFRESHGIRPWKLREVLDDPDFRPDLLLTCDTGIAEAEAVGIAKNAGLTVVITDHHDLTPEFADCPPGEEPPCGEPVATAGVSSVRRADAIVNPKFQRTDNPLRTLPGVGVAYKLVQRLYELAGRSGEAVQFLDLVALGIVADVAEQVHDARYLLQLGLERLRQTERIGLKALMHNARLDPATVDAESIGFQLGPRMNALGRLDDATVAVELLTTRDAIRAGQLAAQMERLNNQRRLLTSQISQTAFDMLDRQPRLLDFNAVVLTNPNWHAGIVGIVASRLVEEFHKPAVLLLNPPGEPARGSARSTPGVDIGASIAACADLLIGHGGHPGAAGLSLEAGNIDRFRRELSRQIDEHRIDAGPEGLRIDAELPFAELSLPLVEQIQRLAPFGNGNPAPTFMSRRLSVADDRRIGRDGTHRRLLLQDADGNKQPVLWWRGADVELPDGPIDIAFTLSVNEFRGERSPQLTFRDARPAQQETLRLVWPQPSAAAPAEAPVVGDAETAAAAATAPVLEAPPAPALPRLPLHDLRGQRVALAELPDAESAFWYAEGGRLGEVAFHSRLEAPAAPEGRPLVVWSSPPAPEVLHWLVETLAPSAVFLIGRETGDDRLDGVLRQVAGMAKYALSRDGRLPIDRLAARIATTEAVIRRSLLWLEVKGLLRLVEWEGGDVVRVEPGESANGNASRDATEREILQSELQELLAEVRAYRRFFQRAKPSALDLPQPQKKAEAA